MIRFLLLSILVMLVARAFWQVFDGVIHAAGGGRGESRGAQPPAVKLVRDPVCGTYVSPSGALRLHQGADAHTEYFCSERCRDAFAPAHPGRPRPHAS